MAALLPLILLALGGVAVAFIVPGWSDLILIAGPSALAGLILLGWRILRGARRVRRRAVLDGSNVMHWKDGKPGIDAIREVIHHLERRGFEAGVVFDANAGYRMLGRYQHDGSMARRLFIPERNVLVVNKGEPADPRILSMARDLGAIIVTNDRFRDWSVDFPEVLEPGHLVRGGYRDGRLWLDLPDDGLPR